MTTVSNSQNERLSLTGRSFAQALDHLSDVDTDLAGVVRKLGPPPMWKREEGFPTLVHIILEQQVSLSSAKAAYDRLLAATGSLTPKRFLQLDDTALKRIGFSRQKTAYNRNLADAILQGKLDLTALGSMDDDTVRSELIKIKGIGTWTADIYLLMVLQRPDVWPRGDLALAKAIKKIKRLKNRPGPKEMDAISTQWMPWRAVAARLIWHYYLNSEGRRAF